MHCIKQQWRPTSEAPLLKFKADIQVFIKQSLSFLKVGGSLSNYVPWNMVGLEGVTGKKRAALWDLWASEKRLAGCMYNWPLCSLLLC